MKFYNYQTGGVIVIDKIKDSGIFYRKFGNIYYADRDLYSEKKNISGFDKKQVSSEQYPMFEQFEKELIIKAIKEAETGFDLAPNEQCWIMPEKAYRTIANSNYAQHYHKKTALFMLFEEQRAYFSEQSFTFDDCHFIYSSGIDDNYRPILEGSPETITIEEKSEIG